MTSKLTFENFSNSNRKCAMVSFRMCVSFCTRAQRDSSCASKRDARR